MAHFVLDLHWIYSSME